MSITFADHQAKLDKLELRPIKESLRIPDAVGIIGRDVIGNGVLTVDYPRNRIWLDIPRDEAALVACEHVAPGTAEVDVVDDGFLYVRGKAETTDGYFLVDTGASLGAMPESVFDTLDASVPRPWLGGFYTPAMLGKFWAKLTIVRSLEVGGARVEEIATRTTPDDKPPGTNAIAQKERFLGVLPSGYLSHFMVTFDYPAKRLRLAAKKDDSLSEPRAFFTRGCRSANRSTRPCSSRVCSRAAQPMHKVSRWATSSSASTVTAWPRWILTRVRSGCFRSAPVRRSTWSSNRAKVSGRSSSKHPTHSTARRRGDD